MAVRHVNQTTPVEDLVQQFEHAFDHPMRSRAEGLTWLRNSIAVFERKYGMTSAEMVDQVAAGQLDESDDICSWLVKAELLRDVESAS